MLGLRLITCALIALGLLIFALLFYLRPSNPGIIYRTVTLLGIFLTFSGFFFEPWIEFDFLRCIFPTSGLLQVLIPGDLVILLIQKFGAEWIGILLAWFERFTQLTGLTMHLLPTLGIGIWFIIWMPLIPLFISPIILGLGLFAPGTKFARIGGWTMLCSSAFNILVLLPLLPHLDAVGVEGDFRLSLLSTLLCAHLGVGPWICILGLIILAAGGVIEITDQGSSNHEENYPGSYEPWQ